MFQFSSVAQSCITPWTAAHHPSLSITNSQSLLKLMYNESVMPSNHLILSCLLLPPSVFPNVSIFSNEAVLCIRWPKYWSQVLINQSILKEISPEYSLGGLMLKLMLQYQTFASVKLNTQDRRVGSETRRQSREGRGEVPEGRGHLPALEGWGYS